MNHRDLRLFDAHLHIIVETLGTEAASKVFYDNAIAFYHPKGGQ